MVNSTYYGMGEILQGNTPIGEYRYELGVTEKENDESAGVIYVGDKANVFSTLIGTELVLRLEDGFLCAFHISCIGSKMGIKTTKPVLH